MPDINVNINGDDAERAAQHADAAAAAARAASEDARRQAAKALGFKSSLYDPSGNRFLDKLRSYQQFQRTAGPTQAMWTFQNQAWAANNFGMGHAAAQRNRQAAPAVGGGGGGGGGGQGGGGGGGLGGPAPNGGWAGAPMAGWKQPGWGTNKANFTAGTGIGGNFGKGAFAGGISSAKARSVWNLTTNLANGSMPVIFRTALALYLVQKTSALGREVFEIGMKGVNKSDANSMVALKFSSNVGDAAEKHIKNMGKSVVEGAQGAVEFAGMGMAGLGGVALLFAGRDASNNFMGSVLKGTQWVSDRMGHFYLGESGSEKRYHQMSGQANALADAALAAKAEAHKYAMEFSDRNAEELAALGFGTGAQIRGLVTASRAYQKLEHNAGLKAIGDDVIEPSKGDD